MLSFSRCYKRKTNPDLIDHTEQNFHFSVYRIRQGQLFLLGLILAVDMGIFSRTAVLGEAAVAMGGGGVCDAGGCVGKGREANLARIRHDRESVEKVFIILGGRKANDNLNG